MYTESGNTTTGRHTFCHQVDGCSTLLASDPFCLCKSFSYKAYLGTKAKRSAPINQQPRTKERRTDKTLTNRASIAHRVPPFGLSGVSFVRASESFSRTGIFAASPVGCLGFPGHALHEKQLQRQKSGSPLVSSQERRVGLVPRVNRTFCSHIGLHRTSLVRASEESFRTVLYDALGGTRDGCPLGESFGVPSCFSPPRHAAPPCAAPIRSARNMSGVWIRQVGVYTCRVQNPNIPPAGRVWAHGGAAGRGRAGRDADRTVRPGNKRPSYPPRHRRRLLNVPPKARTNKILCKPSAGTKSAVEKRFIRGLSAVYHRDEKRSSFLAADQWTDAFLSL